MGEDRDFSAQAASPLSLPGSQPAAVQALGLQASWTQFFGKDARSLRKGEEQADGAESPTPSDVPIQFTQPGTDGSFTLPPWAPLPTPAPPHPCPVMPTPSVSVFTHCPSTPATGLAAASPQRRRTPCLYRLQGMERLRQSVVVQPQSPPEPHSSQPHLPCLPPAVPHLGREPAATLHLLTDEVPPSALTAPRLALSLPPVRRPRCGPWALISAQCLCLLTAPLPTAPQLAPQLAWGPAVPPAGQPRPYQDAAALRALSSGSVWSLPCPAALAHHTLS